MKVVVHGLTKVFSTDRGDLRSLGGINLEVRDREFFGIIGHVLRQHRGDERAARAHLRDRDRGYPAAAHDEKHADPDFSLCMEKIWNLMRYDIEARCGMYGLQRLPNDEGRFSEMIKMRF